MTTAKPPVPTAIRRRTPSTGRAALRQLVRWAHRAADRNLFGMRPGRAVIVCGMPRSGSTLLQLMLQTGYPDSKHYGRERGGLLVARDVWPGRYSLLISKRPNDVFWVDEIRELYRERARAPLFIVTTRDPRAVMTSKHANSPEYYVSAERWKALFDHIRYVRSAPDVLTLDYRDLVQTPRQVGQRLAEAIGEEPAVPFDSVGREVPSGFQTAALNGVRPIDTSSLNKWRDPQHSERIRAILAELPELPSILVQEGYETDTSWTDRYR
jgi:hypothetical protein